MTEKKIYFGLGVCALLALLLTAALIYKAGRLSRFNYRADDSAATASAVLDEPEASPSAVTADLTVNYGDARRVGENLATYSAVPTAQRTALDLLLQAAKINNFTVDYEEQSFGAFIKSIGGIANQKSVFWLYYVNGLPAPIAADKQDIKNGDRVEFRFTGKL